MDNRDWYYELDGAAGAELLAAGPDADEPDAESLDAVPLDFSDEAFSDEEPGFSDVEELDEEPFLPDSRLSVR